MFNLKKNNKENKTPAPTAVAGSPVPEFELISSEKVLTQGATAIRDLIAPASLQVQSSYLELNGQFVRTFFVYNYPRYLNVGWFSPFINFSATMDIAIY